MTYTPEQMRKMADWMMDQQSMVLRDSAAMLRQGADAVEALAAKETKVRELREWLVETHEKRCKTYQASGHSYHGGMCDGFDRVQTELDALGLTGAEMARLEGE